MREVHGKWNVKCMVKDIPVKKLVHVYAIAYALYG